jgi:hypothetical protein
MRMGGIADCVSKMQTCLNIGAGICGLISAGLWWWASWLPRAKQSGNFMNVVDSEGLTPMMREAGRRNRWAATFTGLAVLLGAVANLIPH